MLLCCSPGHEKLIRIFDLKKPDSEPEVLPVAPDKIRGAAFLNNDQLLLTSYIDKPGVRCLSELPGNFSDIPEETLLLAPCCPTNTVCSIWDVRSQQIVRTLETPKVVTSIEVQPDSSFIVTADGNEAKFWDGASFGLKKSFKQPYDVESVTFCPEKGRFVVGGEDMWVHLHAYNTGEEVECNKGAESGCTTASTSSIGLMSAQGVCGKEETLSKPRA